MSTSAAKDLLLRPVARAHFSGQVMATDRVARAVRRCQFLNSSYTPRPDLRLPATQQNCRVAIGISFKHGHHEYKSLEVSKRKNTPDYGIPHVLVRQIF